MSDLHDIPSVSQSVDSDVRTPLTRLIEGYRALAGFSKDPYARAVTVGEVQAGVIVVGPGVSLPIGGGTTVVTVPGGGGGTPDTPDSTPPPTVTGLIVTAGFTYITVEWDAPTYTEGRGHLQTNIYAAKRNAGDPLPTFGDAELVYSATGALTIAAIPSEMNTIWHVWAKWETVDLVESTSPAGGVNGETATTGQDVTQLMAVLAGQITSSELHATLGTRIDLIDAPSSTVGSVNQRIATVSARLDSGGDVATAIITAQSTATTANATAGSAASDAAAALGAATSTASQLTTLQSSIAGAGGNLLANSSFEVDYTADGVASAWGVYTTIQATTVSQVAGRTGGLAQRVAWVGTNTSVKGLYTDSAMAEGGLQGGIRGGWQPNKTYVISWYARASSGAAGAVMANYWNNAPASTTTLANPTLSASAWQRYAFRITTGATVEPNGRLYISILNGTAATGYIEIDDAMVQEGDLLTGYVLGDQPALTAALQQETTTRASQTGALLAQWTVKVDINGYVSGFGLASTANNAAPTSAFIVRADSFSVASPSGPGIPPIVPFIVRTTPATVNGVTVPVGVWMDLFYAQNGSLTNAKIGNLAVDDAKIANMSVAKLIAGTLQVGAYIRSTNYVAGTSGFNIPHTGDPEFNNITARGTIYAQAAHILGQLVAAQIDGRSLVIRRSDNSIVLNADDTTPPWVTAGDIQDSATGTSLLAAITGTNTRRLRNLLAGPGIDIAISGDDQNLTLSALASETDHLRNHLDRSTTSTTQSDVSGFALPLLANTTYVVRGLLRYTTAATTTGFALGVSVPAGAALTLVANAVTSGAGATEMRVIDLPSGGSGSAIFSASPPNTSIAEFEAVVVMGGTAGNFQIRFASEVSGSNVSLLAGSALFAHRLQKATTSVTVNLASSTVPASYLQNKVRLGGGSATSSITFNMNRNGTWDVSGTGTGTGSVSGSPTSGNWASPTDTDAGAQWEVQFVGSGLVQSGTGSGSGTHVNDAPSYVPLTSTRSFRVTSSVSGPTNDWNAHEDWTINLRRISNGSVTAWDTVTLSCNAVAEN